MLELNLDLLGSPGIRHVHMIGIDGISMSGLAEILLNLGYKVTGSDIKTSVKTKKLESMGAKVYSFHSEDNVSEPDLVVYSSAIKENNPEIRKAKKLAIPIIDRATLLGEIMKRYPYAIAVSGTHGKTTTTSMIATVMIESGLDPTVHIGGELPSIGGTTRIGGNRYFVTEACEYCGNFLKLRPYLAVILNIEYDHADYFRDIEHVTDTFYRFSSLVPDNGYIIGCIDDPRISALLDGVSCKRVTFGINSKEADWSAGNIEFDDNGCASFMLLLKGKELTDIRLRVPGIHNLSNALATIAACHVLGCDISSAKHALAEFSGAHQRFELKGTVDGIRIFDDYAHHPTEIKATLNAAKRISHSKIWCVFQPHTYSRTKSLMNDFAASFSDADVVIVSDIYAAREIDNGDAHASQLAEKISETGKKAVYIPGFEDILEYLKKNVSPGDIIITMGAGNISKVADMFLEGKKVMAIG